MIGFIVSIICILVVQATVAGAESYQLSLKDAIRMSVEQNHRVRAVGFSAEASRKGVAIATSRYYPTLAFEESFNVSNSPTQTFMMKLDEGRFTQNDFLITNLNRPETQHDFRTALAVRLPIYDPANAATRDIAVASADIQETRLVESQQQTAFKVFSRYLDVQKAVSRLRAAEQAVTEAREYLRIAGVRNQNGVGLRSDELRARTQLSSNEQQRISADNNLTIARMELASLIGLTEGDTLGITDTKIVAVPLLHSPEELCAAALENRTELQLTRKEYEKADASLRLATSAYFPSLDGFASYQMNSHATPFGSDNDSWNAGVALTWQLFDGFKRSRERDRVIAEKSAAAELQEDARREAVLRVRESLLRSEEMSKRLDVAAHTLQDAEETVRLVSRRYENSLATMLELIDAQTELNRIRADLVDSEAHYALARGYVYYTAGIFLKEMTK
ncbi:MAG TPA: TolC family protein [Desulfuromonadales bacterium]|nr:TolC family protein [Desulfuromonadales bacterium]